MSDIFKYSNPDLFEELHPSKNREFDFNILHSNSGKKVWWVCNKNSKHIWRQTITARVKQGYGCPYCSGLKTIHDDSFGIKFPKLLAEVHPTKNKDFDPFTTAPKSNKSIWWQCSRGHEWKKLIWARTRRNSTCPECRVIDNSVAIKYPKIAEEWHPTKNIPLTPDMVRPSKKMDVWWKCKKNPNHEWKTKLATRIFSKTNCPHCSSNSKGTRYNVSLLEFNHELCKEWHPTKNTIKPSEISPGSSKKVWWKCKSNSDHIWQAIINNRAIKNRGCPICANRHISPNDSLVTKYPEIAALWHPTKNGTLLPDNVSYGSSAKVWWQCKNFEEHEWQETVHARMQRNKTDCPICSKSTYAYSNTLESLFPQIAEQWHPIKNGRLKPSDVTKATNKKVWWQCSDNEEHEWEAQVKNRTILNSGCPHCATEKNLIRLTEHLFELDHKDINYYHIFSSNIRSLEKLLLSTISNERLQQPFNRMIYSFVITSIETYLSDAFIKSLFSNNSLIEKFVITNPELNKRNYNYYEAMNIHNHLEKSIKEYLLNILWHNIPKVEQMYKHVFDINFPKDITFLHKAIVIRHDIVHRSGKTKSGSLVKISKQQIHELIQLSRELIKEINSKLLKVIK